MNQVRKKLNERIANATASATDETKPIVSDDVTSLNSCLVSDSLYVRIQSHMFADIGWFDETIER